MGKPKQSKNPSPPPVPSDDDYGNHTSRDTSGRFAVDALLRAHGWQIWERKRNQPPRWLKGNRLLDEVDALATLPDAEVADAIHDEQLYYRSRG